MTPIALYSLLLAVVYVIYRRFKYRKIIKTIKEIAEDNGLKKDKTKFKIRGNKAIITNYKKIPTDNLEKIPSILSEETGKRYRLIRNPNKIILERFKEIPKRPGVYSQNVITGKTEEFSLEKQRNYNGLLVVGQSGTGKSEIVKALTKNKNRVVFSPKGDRDFTDGQPFSPEMIKAINHYIDNYDKIEDETFIIVDEIITFIALIKQLEKELLEKMSINFTICRDSKLKWIMISQSLSKEQQLSLNLINKKIINHTEIKNFTKSLGITSIKTPISSLKIGQFILFDEDGEHLIQNNISP